MSRVTSQPASPGTPSPIQLPIRVAESGSPLAGLLKAVLWLMAVAAGAAPIVLVTAYAVASPGALAVVAANPIGGVQLALGVGLWTGLVLAVRRALRGVIRSRSALIGPHEVIITDRTIYGATSRTLPTRAFAGVAHRVRSSFSGATHELVLVHPEPGQTIVVRSAPRIAVAEIEDVATALGLPALGAASAGPAN